jgi:hypothetical protein
VLHLRKRCVGVLLCAQVSRRLPRTALDPLMGALPPGPPSPPDATFHITRGGTGEHSGLVLYRHKTYKVSLLPSHLELYSLVVYATRPAR